MLEFGVLGPLIVNRFGEPAEIRTAMLRKLTAILLCCQGQPLPVDTLIEALWEARAPSSARKTLQIYVHRLRHALGDNRVPRGPAGYSLTVYPNEFDALCFRDLAARAGEMIRRGELSDGSTASSDALALWRGQAYADVNDTRYIATHARELEELRLEVLHLYATAELELGRHQGLAGTLTAPIAQNPYRETLHGHMMLALYRSGRQAEALAHYRSHYEQMVGDLGVEPGPDLRRLHKDILRNDPALLRIPEPTVSLSRRENRPHQLPPANANFVGRVSELYSLESTASNQPASARIILLTGTAGVGKTTTAVYWAHAVASRFPDGQLHMNLRGFDPSGKPVDPSEALSSFLLALGVSPESLPAALEARTGLFRSLVADKRILLLLDNARDADQVRPLLPGSDACLVVVTSRNPLTGLVVGHGASSLKLDLLGEEESWQLIARRLSDARVDAEPIATRQLISRCAGLPLALAVVAARALTSESATLASIVVDLDGVDSSLDALAVDDTLTDVRTVFSWSYGKLRPRTSLVFRMLGLHPGPEITLATAADLACVSLAAAADALAELVESQLVTETSPGRFAMHDLLRSYAEELFTSRESQRQQETARRRMLDHYLHTSYAAAVALNPDRPPISMPSVSKGLTIRQFESFGDARSWLATEFQATRHCVDIAAAHEADEHCWKLAWAISDHMIRQSRWKALEEMQLVALEAAARLDDCAGLGYAHRYIGIGAAALGRGNEGAARLAMALEQFTNAGLLREQGHVLTDFVGVHQNQPTVALRFARRARRVFRQAGDHVAYARALNVIGWAFCLLGDPNRGLIYSDRALQIFKEHDVRYTAAATWSTHGLALHQLHDHGQAIVSYQESVECYRHQGRHGSVAETLTLLGDSLQAARRPAEAIAAWQEAMAIYEDLGIPHNLGLKLAELSAAR